MILNHPTARTSHDKQAHTLTRTHMRARTHTLAHTYTHWQSLRHALTKLARVRLLRYTQVAKQSRSGLVLCTGWTGAVAGHSLRCQVQLFSERSHRTSVSITALLRRWSSGRILPCHGRDPGSIPGRRTDLFSPVGLSESCAGSKRMQV